MWLSSAAGNSLKCIVYIVGLGITTALFWAMIKRFETFLVQCSAVQCSAVQCSAVQCSAVQCSAVQCSAVQSSAVQCSAVQCSAGLWDKISLLSTPAVSPSGRTQAGRLPSYVPKMCLLVLGWRVNSHFQDL